MIRKVFIGLIAASIIGMFVDSFFVADSTTLRSLFLSKITLTSLIVGFLAGIYAAFSKSKLQVFLISVIIGICTFYLKYLVTGHDLDPLTMGAFVGALLGGVFAIDKKIRRSIVVYRRLKRLRMQRTDENYLESNS